MLRPLDPEIAAAPSAWMEDRLQVRCVRIDAETHDVATFVFRADEPLRFGFKPGQFITVEPVIDGRTVPRTYSISSPPSRPLAFSITVKRVPDGRVSNWLHDHLREGDTLTVSGPQGDFNFVDRPAERVLMLSGGSGITPVMSMARWLHDTGADVDVHFVHCARTPHDLIYHDELNAIAATNRRFRLSLVCETADDTAWSGYRGRLDAGMLEGMVPDLMERTVYTCGPEPYMVAVRDILGGLGFPAARYHEESFGGGAAGPAPAAEAESSDPAAGAVTPVSAGPATTEVTEARTGHAVRMERSGLEFTCAESETLLQAAQRSGGWIPCACQMGVCGTCKVLKTTGAVSMQAMGGVAPDEEEAGYVLACCSYPRGPVTLDC